MGVSIPYRDSNDLEFAWNEITGAIGDSVTVLPLVVAVAVLTELSLSVMLVWFGIFQIVWGLYYGVPLSVEPMKALAALILAGALTTGEFLVAGLLAGAILLLIGSTGALRRLERYIGEPVIRGVQLGVALLLLETGIRLGLSDPLLAGSAAVVAAAVIATGYWNLSALVVLSFGGIVAVTWTGVPTATLPSINVGAHLTTAGLTTASVEATVAQLAMTIGNAAMATSVLVREFFDRDVSADELSASMGVMNLVAVPFGALPMCHGSGGVAGKYAFGARTAGANVVLGVGYVLAAVGAVGLVAAYPLSMLGIVLALVAIELGRAGLRTDRYPMVVGIGLLGLATNLGVAFVVGTAAYLVSERRGRT